MLRFEDAKTHGVIAAQIEGLQMLVDRARLMQKEGWYVSVIKLTAPAEGASVPAGTTFDLLLPGMVADAETSAIGIKTALDMYQTQLGLMRDQLDKM